MNWKYNWLLIILLPVQLFAQGRIIGSNAIDSIINPSLLEGDEVLHFERKEINVGKLSEDDAAVTYRFPFRNVSKEAVTLMKVYTSCGCTAATYTKAVLKPGETGEIELIFNPGGQAGNLNKSAFIYTNLSSKHPVAKLTLTGNVTPTANQWVGFPHSMGNVLRLKRTTLVFREMPRKGMRTERLICVNSGKQALKLSTVIIPRYATFRTEPAVIPPGGEADIVVTIDGNLLPPTPKSEFSFPVIIEGIQAKPSERTVQVKVSLQK